MTTEAPDGPMPLCFSPESFRAAVDRAKKAERRVEELEEALRGIREDERRICEEHDARLAEVTDLRANVATLVEQLADAEQERDGWERAHGSMKRIYERTAAQFRELRDGVLSPGAAQPVVEPRDETLPGGWRWMSRDCVRHDGTDFALHVLRSLHGGIRFESCDEGQVCCSTPVPLTVVAAVLARAGYAPHPSGTADEPTPKWLLDVLRCIEAGNPDSRAMARGALAAYGIVVNTPPEHPSGTEGPLRKALLDLLDADALEPDPEEWEYAKEQARAALAASPPDGTAPERVEEMVPRSRMEAWRRTANSRAALVDKMSALLTSEQIDACIIAAKDDATRPPDGTAPERADRECSGMTAFWCPVHGDCTCPRDSDGECEFDRYDCPLHGVTSEHSEGRPPDGMPGEPDEGEEPITLADLLADLECMLREADAAFANGSDYDYESEIRKTIHRFSPDSTERAAPPTVPGEPREETMLGATSLGGYRIYPWMGRYSWQYIETHDGFLMQAEAKASATLHRNFMRTGSAPSTPPLTPERAPLDEAAVRADEQMKCVAAIRDVQSKLILPDAREFCDLIISRISIIGHENEPASGPRRSEGAG